MSKVNFLRSPARMISLTKLVFGDEVSQFRGCLDKILVVAEYKQLFSAVK